MERVTGDAGLVCPSAKPGMVGSSVIGLNTGTMRHARIEFLDRPLPASDAVLALCGKVDPTELFRFAAQCESATCRNFDGCCCRVASVIVQLLPPVTVKLPRCGVRPQCRWFRQEGRAACVRCPQIVTQRHNLDDPSCAPPSAGELELPRSGVEGDAHAQP